MDFIKLTIFCLVAMNSIEVESKSLTKRETQTAASHFTESTIFSIKHKQQSTYLAGTYTKVLHILFNISKS